MTNSASTNQTLSNTIDGPSSRLWKVTYGRGLKRLCDLLLAIVLLPVIAPVIAVMFLLTRLDGGSGFFGHTRIGKNGRTFRCWKIRTMVTDSEACLTALLQSDPQAMAEWEEHRKLHNDPRITRFGQFLRKSSLDELPQIWNVLRGEMSMVGPRPVTRDELVKYGCGKRSYLSVLPGITGLWQVSGRNDVSYYERVQLDVTYQQDMSFLLDVRILAQTALVLLKRNGM